MNSPCNRDARRTRILRIRLRLTVRVKKSQHINSTMYCSATDSLFSSCNIRFDCSLSRNSSGSSNRNAALQAVPCPLKSETDCIVTHLSAFVCYLSVNFFLFSYRLLIFSKTPYITSCHTLYKLRIAPCFALSQSWDSDICYAASGPCSGKC